MLHCLGIQVTICPPRRPDKNGFVERYNRTYDHECLRVFAPNDIEAVRRLTEGFQAHYNFERPNQALSCGNQPPRVAFPTLPARPSVPLCVDPDAWLGAIDGRAYVRRVSASGFVAVGADSYYLQRDLAGQEVAVQVDAPAREFAVIHGGQELRRLPIKGLLRRILSFEDFVDHLAAQARNERPAQLAATGS